MSDSIRLLFQKRDSAFEHHTREIYTKIPNVIEGVREYLGMELSDMIELYDIQLSEDNILNIIGFIPLTNEIPGSASSTEDAPAKKVVKIGVPLKLAQEGTVEEVLQFLNEAAKTYHKTTKDTPTETLDLFENDWDTDTLSTEQLERLMMYEYTNDDDKDHNH